MSKKYALPLSSSVQSGVTGPMLSFKSFRSAGNVLAGVELMHMIRKSQFAIDGAAVMSFANQFYTLAGQGRPA